MIEQVGKAPINFELINNLEARKVVERMLEFDPTKRATINELLLSDWVTNQGKEMVDADLVDKNQRQGLGNVDRLVKN